MAYYIPAPLTQEMCPKGRHFYTEKGEFDIEKTKAFRGTTYLGLREKNLLLLKEKNKSALDFLMIGKKDL